jgi:hypothetical protein
MMVRWLRLALFVAFTTIGLGAASRASAEPRLEPMIHHERGFHPAPLPLSHPTSSGAASHAPEIHAGALGGVVVLLVGGTLMLARRSFRKGNGQAG